MNFDIEYDSKFTSKSRTSEHSVHEFLDHIHEVQKNKQIINNTDISTKKHHTLTTFNSNKPTNHDHKTSLTDFVSNRKLTCQSHTNVTFL